MKFLWVNNVGNIIGGTLACTLSMIRSFPDVEHTVFSFGRFGEKEYQAFPSCVSLVSGSNVRDFIKDTEYDVIIYQNTGVEQLPNTFPNKPLRIYYQHSNHRSAKQARERCDLTLCVSKYLARDTRLGEDTVLYQPVTIPPKIEDKEYDHWAENYDCVIGRICSPNPSKWKKEDVIDVVDHIMLHHPTPAKIGWHFIGCPEWVRKELGPGSNFYFSDTSFEARGYLHKWDYLLYKSSLPETYGRIVKEAQRSGCVPIVSDLGGFKEQIKDRERGYLCVGMDDFLFAVMDEAKINRNAMKKYGDATGSCSVFRQEFLRRLRNSCSV